MTVLVVTGTDTGVGKTVVTAALAAAALSRGASVAVVKPGQTGVGDAEPGDVDEVLRLTHESARAAGVSPVHGVELARFRDPLAPAAAARLQGVPAYALDAALDPVRDLAERYRLVLVEGAGGLLVRYDDEGTTLADLAHHLAAPCVVVVRAELGTLNHTALTLEAMAHRGLQLAGVVIGAWPDRPGLAAACNVEDLERLAARPLSGAIPAGAASGPARTFGSVARTGLGPELGGTFDAADFRGQARRRAAVLAGGGA